MQWEDGVGTGTKTKKSWEMVAICAGALLAAGTLCSISGQPAEAEELSRQSFWNSREVASSNLGPFWKWRSVLERYSKEMAADAGQHCSSSLFSDCPYEQWRGFLAEMDGNERWGQLVAVNSFVNARSYLTDERNWGVKDYWATPGEFMARSGDCEDYAIAKYLSLKELGWAEGNLRIVVVRDSKLRVPHAVLVVAYGGRRWVLDNQTDQVNETVEVEHYRPVFSINETSWWHHLPDNSRSQGRRKIARSNPLQLDATPAAAEHR